VPRSPEISRLFWNRVSKSIRNCTMWGVAGKSGTSNEAPYRGHTYSTLMIRRRTIEGSKGREEPAVRTQGLMVIKISRRIPLRNQRLASQHNVFYVGEIGKRRHLHMAKIGRQRIVLQVAGSHSIRSPNVETAHGHKTEICLLDSGIKKQKTQFSLI
jgi:hypothetical protein